MSSKYVKLEDVIGLVEDNYDKVSNYYLVEPSYFNDLPTFDLQAEKTCESCRNEWKEGNGDCMNCCQDCRNLYEPKEEQDK